MFCYLRNSVVYRGTTSKHRSGGVMRTSNHRAFTLVELLVVIAIIGI